MRLLLDTHCLLWAVYDEHRLSTRARSLIEDTGVDLFFSVASIAEIAIKRARNRADFMFEPDATRRALQDVGYLEIPLTGTHALQLRHLEPIHGDPFDRILVAQAIEEGLTIMTADSMLRHYAVPTVGA